MKFNEFKNAVHAESSAKNVPIVAVLARELLRRNLLNSYGQYLGNKNNIDFVFDKLEQTWDENMILMPLPASTIGANN